MEESKDIRCGCGQLVAKARDGQIVVWCKKCKQEYPISLSEQFTFITAEMHHQYGCGYCNDRLARYCPHNACPYSEQLKDYESFEGFFRNQKPNT